MIKFENTEVMGWEHAIRGMRNPMNSWEKSDSSFEDVFEDPENFHDYYMKSVEIGPNDLDLMTRLRNAGTDHRKFMRMITVYTDIIAPLYWWKEFDTYKVGTVANSCSTMHKIHENEFTLEDFSTDHLLPHSSFVLQDIIINLNQYRNEYLKAKTKPMKEESKRAELMKKYWWQMIQLLPSSYNQKRTVMMNYEVLANIYESRKKHPLDEWSVGFMEWIESLPYSELICGPEFLRRKLYIGIDLSNGDDMKGGFK